MELAIQRTRYSAQDFQTARSLFPHLNPSIFRQFTLSPVGPKAYFLISDANEIGMVFFQEHLFEPENLSYRCLHSMKISSRFQRKGMAKRFIESILEDQHHLNGLVDNDTDREFCVSCGFQEKPTYELMEMQLPSRFWQMKRKTVKKKSEEDNQHEWRSCRFYDSRKEKYRVFVAASEYSAIIADEWNELQVEIDEPLVENWVKLKSGIESTIDLNDPFYGLFVVLEHNRDVIGTAKVFIEPSMDGRFDYMYLRRVRILPQYRGLGLLKLFALSAHQIVSTPRTRVIRSIAGRQVSAFEKAGFTVQSKLKYVELTPLYAGS